MYCSKSVSVRNSWCRLQTLRFSGSVSTISIPDRIDRGPTDILNALKSTLKYDPSAVDYRYQDDQYLRPIYKKDRRLFALSYESGKKTAKWILEKHKDLFPKTLSVPEIQAFKPQIVYTDKSQVSEELLLQTILQGDATKALQMYSLLEETASTKVKQAVLEMLCFNCGVDEYTDDHMWCNFFGLKKLSRFQMNQQIIDLYEFLIKEDHETAVAAHNALICGLGKWQQVGAAWTLYKKCIDDDIPLDVITYNIVISLIGKVKYDTTVIIELLYETIRHMNKKKVKPNVDTLNSALQMAEIVTMHSPTIGLPLADELLLEFRRMNVKFTLGTYYYLLRVHSPGLTEGNFEAIVKAVSEEKENLPVTSIKDGRFFDFAMSLADRLSSREVGDMIHDIFLTAENSRFIHTAACEDLYYTSFIKLALKTRSIEEFFEIYDKYIPNVLIPSPPLLQTIVTGIENCAPDQLKQYVPKLWKDAESFYHGTSWFKDNLLTLMCKLDLEAESPLIKTFADAAWVSWQQRLENAIRGRRRNPFSGSMTGTVLILLLRARCTTEINAVFQGIENNRNAFLPMDKYSMDRILNICISEELVTEAMKLLQYAVNVDSYYVGTLASKIRKMPKFEDADAKKLAELVGRKQGKVK